MFDAIHLAFDQIITKKIITKIYNFDIVDYSIVSFVISLLGFKRQILSLELCYFR